MCPIHHLESTTTNWSNGWRRSGGAILETKVFSVFYHLLRLFVHLSNQKGSRAGHYFLPCTDLILLFGSQNSKELKKGFFFVINAKMRLMV